MKEKSNKKINVGALSVRDTRKNLPNCAQKGNKGITIVALIITVIVLLILAVVAIQAIQGDGIIVQATKSAFMNKAKKYEEELNLYIYNKSIDGINNGFDKSTLFANDITTPSIKEIIKSISKEDETKFVIREGKLEYIGEGTKEIEWSKDLGIESKNRLKIYGNSVQNGTPTPDNPIEIKSVGDKTLNLLNPDDFIEINSRGGTYNDTKIITSSTTKGIIIACEPNTTYVLQRSQETSRFRFFYYETEPIIGETLSIGGIYGDSGEIKNQVKFKFTTSENTHWLAIILGTNEELNKTKVWLTKGTEVKDYEPYGKYKIPIKLTNESEESEITNIYLDEPLRKVGDYADYINFSNGKVVRNIGVIENYNINRVYYVDTNTVRFGTYNPEILTRLNTKEILCEILPYKGKWLQDEEYAFKHDGEYYHFYLSFTKTRLGITDDDTNDTMKQKVKDYLSTLSNKKIYYPMQEVEEENISLPELKTYEDNINIEVLTSIAPSKIEK